MDHGPRRRIVQRVMDECLSRIRQHGEVGEEEFARAVADLPQVLREAADQLENPPEGIAGRHETQELEGYALWAPTYDELAENLVVAAEEATIHEMIGPVEGLRVLDVGCGTGRHALPLAARGAYVVGLDPTPEMIDRARAKAAALLVDVKLEVGGVDSLDDRLGEFDLVLCCLVLSHVEDLHDAAARLAGRVARGGRLIVSDFHPMNLVLGFRTAFRHEGRAYVVPNHLHPVSEYFAAMRDAGLLVARLCEPGSWKGLPGVPTTLLIGAARPA
jgi:malonyl-CoA O-methyltransferase